MGHSLPKCFQISICLNSIGWNNKYSTVSVKEFAELLRQNFAQPLPLTDFSGNKLFYLPNLAQISTNGIQKTE